MARIHLIGNAHIDPVWLWRWQEGFAEVKATFRSALDRMQEFPCFVFTCAGAAYYRWVEENAPALFAEIRQRVAEGRWVIVGGWWLQPDCNLPSGESFVRHALYSQRYFMEKFGRIARTGYNVDSFGHNAMLPQLLSKSGMDSYVMMRPQQHEKALPSSVFWWESPDGSRVLTYRIPFEYTTHGGREAHVGKVDAVSDLSARQGVPLMLFYGVGNHGGGPTIASLRVFEELKADRGPDMLDYSSPDAYFAELRSSGMAFPVVKDDLQYHASGCYSAMSEIKANNRKAECRLVNAEKMMTVANRLLALDYDRPSVKKAWEGILFNQFHDILCGCCIQEAYDDARELHGQSLALSAGMLNASVQKLSWAIDTSAGQDTGGAPVVVFNPLSWAVQAHVQVTKRLTGLTDELGAPMMLQEVRAPRTNREDKRDSLFSAVIPPMGYRVFWAYSDREFNVLPGSRMLEATAGTLENDWLKLEVDAGTGYLSSLLDKTCDVEVFRTPGAVPIVIDDSKSDTWAHGVFAFHEEIGRFSDAQVSLIESGPLRATIRVTSFFAHSSLRQDISLYRDKPGVEVSVKLDWRETHRMLKLGFPVGIKDAKPVYEIPYGAFRREADGLECPGQSWLDVSGSLADGSPYGLALANTTKYSYDVSGADLRMTVARSAMFADHYGVRDEFAEYIDQGIQHFQYILVPHRGAWQQSGIARRAQELLNPVITLREACHQGPLPMTGSFLSIDRENVMASVLKKTEGGNGLILRCVETYGSRTHAEIDLVFAGAKWSAEFGPFEIKTFHIGEDGIVSETDLLEMPVG